MFLGFLRKTFRRARVNQLTALPSCAKSENVRPVREAIAAAFLQGDGIEIGALHQPLKVPEGAHVKYVDRMSVADLRRQYVELADVTLVETDIIDNGESLERIADGSHDFVVANHFIEHCQNPILTIRNLLRVLRVGGVVYMAVPDKRYTFDIDRPCTSFEHLMRDYVEGPAASKRQHFEEWTRLVNKSPESRVAEEVRTLMDMDYSIHFHVWGAQELLDFVGALQKMFPFELEMFCRNAYETIVVMRKVDGGVG
jgi:predicted SAM-dependent methyltransferase